MARGAYQRYYNPVWWNPDTVPTHGGADYLRTLRESFEAAGM